MVTSSLLADGHLTLPRIRRLRPQRRTTDRFSMVPTRTDRIRCAAQTDNGMPAFVVFNAIVGIFCPFFDVLLDWLVGIQASVSERQEKLYGDVVVYERHLGYALICMLLIGGYRVAFWDLRGFALPWRTLLAVFYAPVANLKGPWYRLQILKQMQFVKDSRTDPVIKDILERTLSASALEAKWESLPQLLLTCFKIGLVHKVSIIELVSITSSALSISHVLASTYNGLRKRSGLREFSIPEVLAFTLVLAIPIFATAVTSTIFSMECERDGLFVPTSDNPNQTTPGLLFLLMFFPLVLLFFMLASLPQLNFVFFPYRLETLKSFSTPINISSLLLRLVLLTALFSVNLLASIYFLVRDNFPSDTSIFLDHSFVMRECPFDSSLEPLCSVFWAKLDFKVSHGRRTWIVFHSVLVVFLLASFTALFCLVLNYFKHNGHQMVKSLYCDLLMTEGHQILQRLGSKVTVGTQMGRKLIAMEEMIVKGDRHAATSEDLPRTEQDFTRLTQEIPEAEDDLTEAGLRGHGEHLCDIIGRLNAFLTSVGFPVDVEIVIILKTITTEIRAYTSTVELKDRKIIKKRYFVSLPIIALIIVTVTSVLVQTNLERCPDGLNHFLPIRGSCYHFGSVQNFIEYDDAKQLCKDLEESTLVEIYSKDEMELIEKYLEHLDNNNKPFWIGLTRKPPTPFMNVKPNQSHQDLLVWNSTAQEPQFSLPWQAGNPTRNEIEKCIDASYLTSGESKHFLFNDIRCCNNCIGAFMCKLDARKKPSNRNPFKDCPTEYQDMKFKSSCYHYESNPGKGLQWEKAASMCKKNNGTLAIFETKQEWEEIKDKLKKMKGGKAWIGGKKINGRFEWMNGKTMNPRRTDDDEGFGWLTEITDMKNGSCTMAVTSNLNGEFGWFSGSCTFYALPFLCETPSLTL